MSKGKLLSQQLQKALANENLADVKTHLEAGANILDNTILAMGIQNEEIINILVPYISEEYKEKQTKYKISPECYPQYMFRFLKLGYSIEEANKIIFQKKYGSTIDVLLNQSHSKLMTLGYQHKDIVRIASCGASFQNIIKSLLESHEVIELGFSQEEIIKVVACDGGSNNLLALTQNEKPLRALGFSRKELIKVVAHSGGSNNLQALINYVDPLEQGTETNKIFTSEMRDALVKIVAHHGGAKNLLALAQHEKPLCALGFSRKELIKVVAHDGGSNNLQALINYMEHLKEDKTEITKILNSKMRDALVKIVGHDGGSKNLAALTQHEGPLRALGFSRQELIKAVGHNGGSNNLQALVNYADYLKQDGTEISKFLTSEMRDALVKIVARHGGSKNLAVLTQHEAPLCAIGFYRQELINVVAHDSGSHNLQSLINYVDHLKQDGVETGKCFTSEMRKILVKIVAHDGGFKNLAALLENEPNLDKLGLSKDKRIYRLLQRKAGHQRLKFFLHYYLFFYHCNAVQALLASCSISAYLSVEKLNTILALNALSYYLKETTNDDEFNLLSWNSSRFPDELSLLNKILTIVNRKLKGDIYPLKLQRANNNYRITSRTSRAVILNQIEKKLTQYSFNDSVQLQELLTIRNADCYRLLQNPEGNKEVYWLDVRPWKRVFPDKNLQTTLTKLLKKGVKDSDILLDENESPSQSLSILRIGEHALSIPVSVIEAIVNDYPNLHRYQLILSKDVPRDWETKLGFLYLYKTDKTLEYVVKNGKKLENLVINMSSLTSKQNDEISEAFASTDSKSQLYRSTLRALSRLILDTGKNHYLFSKDSDEIIEFIDYPDNFFSYPEDKLVSITKLNKSPILDNTIHPILESSHAEITVLANNNEPNKIPYLSMPILKVSPIRPTLPNKNSQATCNSLGEIGSNLVANNKFIECDNMRQDEIKKNYKPKRKLPPLSVFSEQKKSKKNVTAERADQMVSGGGIYLGEGTYNRVYRFGSTVQKTRKNTALEMDGAKRAVRVFNEINKELNSEPGRGNVINENTWELPYIDGYVPSIEKLSNTILEIYMKTERVLIDGYCKDNILKEKQSGKLYCIDPGLAVRRNSVISKNYWYNPNASVKANREVHYKYMVELIAEYKKNKKPDKSLPIFCIFGIDFYDQNLVIKYGKIHDLCHETFLVLGIAVYFSILLKIKLNADACIRLLRQEIQIDLESLKRSYAEEDMKKSEVLLKPLFFFNPIAANQKRKVTSELQWGLITFQPKRQKTNGEKLPHEVILKSGSKLM
ncbi:MAG: hypothetical protein V4471_03795 [Pseudomonadota bacterium]